MGKHSVQIDVNLNNENLENGITEAQKGIKRLNNEYKYLNQKAGWRESVSSTSDQTNTSTMTLEQANILKYIDTTFAEIQSAFGVMSNYMDAKMHDVASGFTGACNEMILQANAMSKSMASIYRGDANSALRHAEAARVQADRITKMSSAIGVSQAELKAKTGLNQADYSSVKKQLSDSVLNRASIEMARTKSNSGMSIESLVNGILRSSGSTANPILKTIQQSYPTLTKDNIGNIVKSILIQQGPSYGINLNNGIARTSSPLRSSVGPQSFSESIPAVFRDAFTTKGNVTLKRSSKGLVKQNVWDKIVDFMQKDEDAYRLNEAFSSVGLSSTKDFKTYYAAHPSVARTNALAQNLVNILKLNASGQAYNHINPNSADPNKNTGNIAVAKTVLEMLSEDENIRAGYSSSKSFKDIATMSKKQAPVLTHYGRSGAFFIPKTEINSSGKTVYRDPKDMTYSNSALIGDPYKTDEWVTMQESAITRTIKQRQDKSKTGMSDFKSDSVYGGTFGFGRDKDDKPIYSSPLIVSYDKSSLAEIDKSTGKFKATSAGKSKEVQDFLGRKSTITYGDREYVSIRPGLMMESKTFEQINNASEKSGLSSMFNNYNELGLTTDVYETSIGQIDALKRLKTPTTALKDKLGQSTYSKMKTLGVNLNGLYDFLGTSKDERINGVAIADLIGEDGQQVKGVSGLLRGAGAAIKGQIQTTDLSGLFSNVGLFDDKYYGGKSLLFGGTSKEKVLNLPSMNTLGREDIIESLIRGSLYKYDKSGKVVYDREFKDGEAEDFLKMYTTPYYEDKSKNGNVLLAPDEVVKNIDKFRALTTEHYKKMFNRSPTKTATAYELAKEGLIATGGKSDEELKSIQMARLNAEEINAYMQKATEDSGGYGLGNSGLDYMSKKNTIGRQVVESMPFLSRKFFDNSAKERSRIISGLEQQLPSYVREFAIGRDAEDKLRSIYGENWMRSEEAQRLIGNQLNSIRNDNGERYYVEGGTSTAIASLNPIAFVDLFSQLAEASGQDTSSITTSKDYKLLKTKSNEVISSVLKNKKGTVTRFSRDPDSPGASIAGYISNNKKQIEALREYGIDTNAAVMMPWLVAQANGGDMDTDTMRVINLVAEDMDPVKNEEHFKELYDEYTKNHPNASLQRTIDRSTRLNPVTYQYLKLQKNLEEYDNAHKGVDNKFKAKNSAIASPSAILDPNNAKLGDLGQLGMEYIINAENATQYMGLASAIQREAASLPEGELRERLIAEAQRKYDLATVAIKRPDATLELEGWSNEAQALVKQGRLWSRFFHESNNAANGTIGFGGRISSRAPMVEKIKEFNPFAGNPLQINDKNGLYEVLSNQVNRNSGNGLYSSMAADVKGLIKAKYGDNTAFANAADWYTNILLGQAYGTHIYRDSDIQVGRNHVASMEEEIGHLVSMNSDGKFDERIKQMEKEKNGLVRSLNQMENPEYSMSRENVVRTIKDLNGQIETMKSVGQNNGEEYESIVRRRNALGEFLRRENNSSELQELIKAEEAAELKRIQQMKTDSSKYSLSVPSEYRLSAAGLSKNSWLENMKTSWSYVKDFMPDTNAGKGFVLSGLSIKDFNNNIIEKNATIEDVLNKKSQLKNQDKILSKEAASALGVAVEEEYNSSAVVGNIIHSAIEGYLTDGNSKMSLRDRIINIIENPSGKQNDYVSKMNANNNNTASFNKSTGLIENVNEEEAKLFSTILGTMQDDGTMSGGTIEGLQKYVDSIKRGASWVESKVADRTGKKKKWEDIGRTGLRVPVFANGEELPNDMSILPDVISKDKDGFVVSDWKSNKTSGAASIVQSAVYINKLIDYKNRMMKEDPNFKATLGGTSGFGQFFDDKGNLLIKKIRGVNYLDGSIVEKEISGADDPFLKQVENAYNAALNSKAQITQDGNVRGVDSLFSNLLQQISYENAVKQAKENNPYLTNGVLDKEKLNNDSLLNSQYMFNLEQYKSGVEKIREISSGVYKDSRTYDTASFDNPLYNRFTRNKKELKYALTEEAYQAQMAQSAGNDAMIRELINTKNTQQNLLALNEANAIAASELDPKKAYNSIYKTVNGLKDSSALKNMHSMFGTLDYARQALNYFTEEGKPYYTIENGKIKFNTKDKDNNTIVEAARAELNYNNAYKNYDELLNKVPSLFDNFNQNMQTSENLEFDSLAQKIQGTQDSPLLKIDTYYNNLQKDIQDKINQKQSEIEQFNTQIEELGKQENNDPEKGIKINALKNIVSTLESSKLKYENLLGSDFDKLSLDKQNKYLSNLMLESVIKNSQFNLQHAHFSRGTEAGARNFKESFAATIFGQGVTKDYIQFRKDSIQKQINQIEEQRDNLESMFYKKNEDGSYTTDTNGNKIFLEGKEELYQKNNVGSQISNFDNQINTLNKEMSRITPASAAVESSFNKIGNSFNRLSNMFARRIFMKLISEVTSFAKTFDASMKSIQAITMKSDSQMSSVKSSTIKQAIGLKTTVANVTSVKESLYRQGLSDADVEKRTESIIKFSTVTGMSVTNATKAITTALKNDLVASADEAIDVLVALGDSAATTAEQIANGMQKAAASAKDAKVSYGELATILTIITSKTQLSGTQAGTALNTIFNRITKVTNKGYASNENGDLTAINDVEAALSSAGISIREEDMQSFRSAYDILVDLAEVWEDLSDLQRSNITYTMAGTRQANMFNSIMDGLSEDNGDTLKEYLGLTENSSGITQSKYEIMVESLNASLNELKSTFEGIVQNLTENEVFTNVIGWITDILEGIYNLTSGMGSFGSALVVLLPIIAALIAKMAVLAVVKNTAIGGVVGGIAAVTAMVAGAALVSGIGNIKSNFNNTKYSQTNEYKANKSYQELVENNDKRNSVINDTLSMLETVESGYDTKIKIESENNLGETNESVVTLNDALQQSGVSVNSFIMQMGRIHAYMPNIISDFESTNQTIEDFKDLILNIEKEQDKMNAVYGSWLISTGTEAFKYSDDFNSLEESFNEITINPTNNGKQNIATAISYGFGSTAQEISPLFKTFQYRDFFSDGYSKFAGVDLRKFSTGDFDENDIQLLSSYDFTPEEAMSTLREISYASFIIDTLTNGYNHFEVVDMQNGKYDAAFGVVEEILGLQKGSIKESFNETEKEEDGRVYKLNGNNYIGEILKAIQNDAKYGTFGIDTENSLGITGFNDPTGDYGGLSGAQLNAEALMSENIESLVAAYMDTSADYGIGKALSNFGFSDELINTYSDYMFNLIYNRSLEDPFDSYDEIVDFMYQEANKLVLRDENGKTTGVNKGYIRSFLPVDSYEYKLKIGDNGPEIGLFDTSKEEILSAVQYYNDNRQDDQEAITLDETEEGWNAILESIVTNSTGNKTFRTASELARDVKTYYSQNPDKNNYADQWKKMYNLSQSSGNFDEWNEAILEAQLNGDLGSLESLMQGDETFTKIINGQQTGEYTMDDLVSYLYNKTYNSDRASREIGFATTASTIGKRNTLYSMATTGNSSQSSYAERQIASELGIDYLEYSRNKGYYNDLYAMSTQATTNEYNSGVNQELYNRLNAGDFSSINTKSTRSMGELAKQLYGEDTQEYKDFVSFMQKYGDGWSSVAVTPDSFTLNDSGEIESINIPVGLTPEIDSTEVYDALSSSVHKISDSDLASMATDILTASADNLDTVWSSYTFAQDELLAKYPELEQYITAVREGTDDLASCQSKLASAIKKEAVAALEEEGKVLSGLSGTIGTILTGNALESGKAVQTQLGSFAEFSTVKDIYLRASTGGQVSTDEWATLGNFFGMSENDMLQYSSGNRSVVDGFGQKILDAQSLYEESAMQIFDAQLTSIVSDREGFSSDMSINDKLNLLTEEERNQTLQGYRDAGFIYLYNNRFRATGTNSTTTPTTSNGMSIYGNTRISSYNKQPKETTIYDNLYASISGATTAQEVMDALSQATTSENASYITSLLNDETFLELNRNGDYRGMQNYIAGKTTKGKYGAYDTQYKYDSNYVTAALNYLANGQGDNLSLLLEGNSGLYDAVSGIIDSSLISRVINGEELTPYELSQITSAQRIASIQEQESRGQLRAGSTDFATSMLSGTEAERYSSSVEFAQSAAGIQEVFDAINNINNVNGINKADSWEVIKNFTGWSDEYISQLIESGADISKAVEGNQIFKDVKGTLEDELKSTFGSDWDIIIGADSWDDAFRQISDGSQEAADMLQSACEIMGLDFADFIKFITGETSDLPSNKKVTVKGISDKTDSSSGYSEDLATKDFINRASSIVSNSANMSNAAAGVARLGESLKLDENQIASMLESAGLDGIYTAMQNPNNEEYFPQYQQMFSEASSYKSLYSDNDIYGSAFGNSLVRISGLQGPEDINSIGVVSALLRDEDYQAAFSGEENIENRESLLSIIQDENNPATKFLSENFSEQYGNVINALQSGDVDEIKTSFEQLSYAFDEASLSEKNLGENSDELISIMMGFTKGGAAASKAAGDLKKLSDKSRDYINVADKFAKTTNYNQLTDAEKDIAKELTGLSEQELKEFSPIDWQNLAEQARAEGQSAADDVLSVYTGLLDNLKNDLMANGKTEDEAIAIVKEVDLKLQKGETDFSDLPVNESAIAQLAAAQGATGVLGTYTVTTETKTITDGNGNTTSVTTVEGKWEGLNTKSGYSGGRKSGGGGGGGGSKKSNAKKLLEKAKHATEEIDHLIELQNTYEDYHESNGNYKLMNEDIAQENLLQNTKKNIIESYVKQIETQMTKVKKNSDDWYDLREQLYEYEEALEEINSTIDENTRKMQKNEEEIRNTKKDVEDLIQELFEDQKEIDENYLNAKKTIEETILDSIKQRYQDEWDLIKQDLDKKKEALQDEMNLIDERLQYRKNAEDEAKKYEQLSEYQSQLSRISADSTRTKEAIELRDKIAQLEEELAWSTAEKEAEAEKQRLQDQIDAIDKYEEQEEEALSTFLEDARNFSEEIDSIMESGYDNILSWLKENSQEYLNSLDSVRETMVNDWESSFNDLKRITNEFLSDINYAMSNWSVEDYIQKFISTDMWDNMTETERSNKLSEIYTAYDALTNATSDSSGSAKYIDYSSLASALSSTDDYSKDNISSIISKHTTNLTSEELFKLVGDDEQRKAKNKALNDFLVSYGYLDSADANNVYDKNTYDAVLKMQKDLNKLGYINGIQYTDGLYSVTTFDALNKLSGLNKKLNGKSTKGMSIPAYAEGGVVDFTGLAWVDGTKSKPESFLSAEDTVAIRAMIEAAKYVSVIPYISVLSSSDFDKTNSIGEVNINITEASFDNDEDINIVAEKVGQAFAKELNKSGINTMNYNF